MPTCERRTMYLKSRWFVALLVFLQSSLSSGITAQSIEIMLMSTLLLSLFSLSLGAKPFDSGLLFLLSQDQPSPKGYL
ncbi:hypothetical protein QBC32DRAFT_338191 [Pseudoneurospora amorphoporcata]|uniref:Uncharacterized protein n=1 Tax=Pseudoneurospora amorphoporcata TaxID=241081 RepID=A0AAN6NX42_9PEZI|nr:hypothetical protein QBC32DRAFT_338191 [Pseudoneurospora amorphoporcata]